MPRAEMTPELIAEAVQSASPNRPDDVGSEDFRRALEKPIRFAEGRVAIEDSNDLNRVAALVWKSASMKIAGAQSAADVAVALMHGMEAGLSPTQCIKNVMIVNGKPAIWGDCLLGLVQSSGELHTLEETFDEKNFTARCRVVRTCRLVDGTFVHRETVRTFSQADAQAAGLWGRNGPWKQYPKRMLQMRARGFGLRDAFADRLGGLHLGDDFVDARTPFDPDQMRAGSGAAFDEALAKVDARAGFGAEFNAALAKEAK